MVSRRSRRMRVEVREVHPQHHEVALREVDNAHDAEDEHQPDAHERVDAADEQSGGDVLEKLGQDDRLARSPRLLVPADRPRGDDGRHDREGLAALPLPRPGAPARRT
jgi:hypothetical protein